jgi:hypothetical protein
MKSAIIIYVINKNYVKTQWTRSNKNLARVYDRCVVDKTQIALSMIKFPIVLKELRTFELEQRVLGVNQHQALPW